ncbi:MAG: Na+/H+ antiporter subunit E [Candidatus Nezhaarchaeota archaeon]|nr:Na+/H+ antiporter subunit E [Candidatus Nezhaarchaeota archaeon]
MNLTKRVLGFAAVFLLLFAFFLVASASVSPADIAMGLIVAGIVAAFTSTMVIKEQPHKAFDVRRWFWALVYFLYFFLVVEPLCHFDVAKRILHPKMPINPGIVRVPYNLKGDYAVTMLACSITNTPGTVVVDLDGNGRKFYVHWIDVKTMEEDECRKAISGAFEKYARRMFE